MNFNAQILRISMQISHFANILSSRCDYVVFMSSEFGLGRTLTIYRVYDIFIVETSN